MNKREDKLIQEGWEKRFVADEPRLSEMIHLYEETGFEVHLESVSAVEEPDEDSDDCQQCRICFDGGEDRYKMIYTRPKKGGVEEV